MVSAQGFLLLTGPTAVDHIATHEELLWRAGEVFDRVESGALSLTTGRSLLLPAG